MINWKIQVVLIVGRIFNKATEVIRAVKPPSESGDKLSLVRQ